MYVLFIIIVSLIKTMHQNDQYYPVLAFYIWSWLNIKLELKMYYAWSFIITIFTLLGGITSLRSFGSRYVSGKVWCEMTSLSNKNAVIITSMNIISDLTKQEKLDWINDEI